MPCTGQKTQRHVESYLIIMSSLVNHERFMTLPLVSRQMENDFEAGEIEGSVEFMT